MPKINASNDLGQIKEPTEFGRQASSVIKEAVDVVNGRLEFDHNLNTQTVSVTFTAANTDVAVVHNFKKTSVHYLPAKKSAVCTVYDGSKANTLNTLYVRSDVPATVTLVLF